MSVGYNMRECVNGKKEMKTCFFIAVFDEGDPLIGRYLGRPETALPCTGTDVSKSTFVIKIFIRSS